jgi:hypothetical protein
MTALERLAAWRSSGAISPEQYDAIAAIERGERFSLFVELNVLLYVGVLSAVAGLAWTIQSHFANLGDAAILIGLTILCGSAFYYCFAKAPSFSRGKMQSPTLAFDYVLYLGALSFGLELAYIESRFEVLGSQWDYYLLLSSVVLFPLAYRFDNRLVLSLALSSLAGWFGLSLFRYSLLSTDELRLAAIIFGALVGSAGSWISLRAGLKPHFLRTYWHVAANALLLALFSGVVDSSYRGLYLAAILLASAAAVYGGIRLQEFAFAAYGTLYGYVALSSRLLDNVRNFTAVLVYLMISGAAVVAFLIWLSRVGRRT